MRQMIVPPGADRGEFLVVQGVVFAAGGPAA
jgi:hypothetical protein